MQSNNSFENDEEEIFTSPTVKPHHSSSYSFRPASNPSRPSLNDNCSRFSSNCFLEENSKSLNFTRGVQNEEDLFSKSRISDRLPQKEKEKQHPKIKRNTKLTVDTEIKVDYKASGVAFNRKSEMQNNLESL